MARFFNFSNSQEFVLELEPGDLLSPEERVYIGNVRSKRRSTEDVPRKEAKRRNELRVIGRYERFSREGRKLFLN